MTHHDAPDIMNRPEQPEQEGGRPERHERNSQQARNGHGGDEMRGHQMQGMVEMAEQVTGHYDEPAPHSERPAPEMWSRRRRQARLASPLRAAAAMARCSSFARVSPCVRASCMRR